MHTGHALGTVPVSSSARRTAQATGRSPGCTSMSTGIGRSALGLPLSDQGV